jgi:hypothetical protein
MLVGGVGTARNLSNVLLAESARKTEKKTSKSQTV